MQLSLALGEQTAPTRGHYHQGKNNAKYMSIISMQIFGPLLLSFVVLNFKWIV
jgi:hypothetical protein